MEHFAKAVKVLWAWFLVAPLERFLGFGMLAGWVLKPWFAVVNVWRRTGAGTPEEERMTMGAALGGTAIRVFDDYFSSFVFLIFWILGNQILEGIGLGQRPALQIIVLIVGIGGYGMWKYVYSGRSIFVMLITILDDMIGVAALILGLHFLWGDNPLDSTAVQFIQNVQRAFPVKTPTLTPGPTPTLGPTPYP